METILVTGGAGYIGAHIVKRLIAQDYAVVVLDNLYSGHRKAVHQNAIFVEGDTADRIICDEIFTKYKIEAVIHMAAHIEVGESVENPYKYYSNNTCNSLQMIKASIEYGVKKFIFSSTAAVYGMPENGLVSELSPSIPINPYGHSKLMTEQMLKDMCAVGNMKYGILRYFNVAGASLDGTIGQSTPRATHLIKVCCEAALGKRESVAIFGADYLTKDGTGVRDYIHVEDLAQAHTELLDYLKQHPSDTFNCGYGKGYSVKEIIEMVKKVSGCDFKAIQGPRRAGDSPCVMADNTKIKSKTSWKPQYENLEIICKTAYEWEKKC